MKKKISLCVMSVLLGSAIYAGPIQERLKAALKETVKQGNDLLEVYPANEYEPFSKSSRKKIAKTAKQSYDTQIHLGLRIELLQNILFCLNQKIKKQEKISNKKEAVIAHKCFNNVASNYQNKFEQQKDTQKILNQELEIIRKRDLRQSWFWWLW